MTSIVPDRSHSASSQFRRSSVGLYCVLSFGIAWLSWAGCWKLSSIPSATTWITPLVILGSFGPFIAAGICAFREGGTARVSRFFGGITDWRMGWAVFLISVALIPSIAIAVAAAASPRRYDPQFQMSWSELPMAYLWLLVLGGPVGEEFGWSYMSDAMDEAVGVLKATLALGLVWAIWHLPLFFLDIPGLSQQFLPFTAFLALSVSMRLMFSWTYHRGGRSILSNVLIHNGLNLSLSLVPIVVPTLGSQQPRLWALTMITGAIGAALWGIWPPSARSTPGH